MTRMLTRALLIAVLAGLAVAVADAQGPRAGEVNRGPDLLKPDLPTPN